MRMTRTRVSRCLLLLVALLCLNAAIAHAAPDLIAVGSISGTYEDFAAETAGLLENGAPGNLLGGIGSGLAHAGGNTFLALPDRGPNGGSFAYNTCIDETASYIDRFQTVSLNLTAGPGLYGLPFLLSPQLRATTLLSSASPLVYGSLCGLPFGGPLQNTAGTSYFTGRSDNFDPRQPSTNPKN